MKRLGLVIALVMSAVTLALATPVSVDYTAYPTCSGTNCGVIINNSGPTITLTPEPLQTIINNNNVTVPATVGSGVNGATPDTVGNLNFVGTGLTSSVSGSGSTATSNVDFSNLQTNQSIQNTTDISNLNSSLNTTNSNVTNLSNTVNSNSTDISSLQTTVNSHTTQINQNTAGIAAINNMSDPSTVLNQTVNNNTTAIANETIRATGVESGIQNLNDGSLLSNTVNTHTTQIGNLQAGLNTTNTNVANLSVKESNDVSALNTGLTNETNRAVGAENTLQGNINNEASARAAGDAALQNQVNNLNARATNEEQRIDRLEQTKYLLEPVVRIYDSKRWQVQAFDSYDVRHATNFALGARVMLKLGKSYEEKLLEKTNPEIARLLAANVRNDQAERDSLKKQLAEDRQLIADQAAALKAIQSQFAGLKSVDINLATTAGNDDELLNAVEKNVEGK